MGINNWAKQNSITHSETNGPIITTPSYNSKSHQASPLGQGR